MDAGLAVHDQVGEPAYLEPVGLGHAHHLGDDVHRQSAGEVGDPVEALTVLGHLQALVEVVVGEPLDLRRELGDPARGEALGDQRAQPLLARRVHAQERRHPVRVGAPGALLDRDTHRVGVDALGADRVLDVGVPGQRPEVVLSVVVQRLLVTTAPVDRVGVLLERVVVRVEDDRAHTLPFMITATTASSRSPISVVGHQAHAALQQRTGERQREGLEQRGVGVVTERGAEPVDEDRTDPQPQPLDVGVGAEQRGRHRGGELRGSRQALGEVAGHRLQPLDRRLPRRLRVVLGQVAPEELGEEVVLRGQVGVRRGRRDAGALGDGADGQRLVADRAQLLVPGGEQPLRGLGLPGVELRRGETDT